MKRAFLALCLGFCLVLPTGAAADTPRGAVSGVAVIDEGGPLHQLRVDASDGGTSYVGLENDLSKDPDGTASCAGDRGTAALDATEFVVVCAHFVASSRDRPGKPKMRFAIGRPGDNTIFLVVRITDNGIQDATGQSPDTVAYGLAFSLATAKAWVNMGPRGSGITAIGWTFNTIVPSLTPGIGDFLVQP